MDYIISTAKPINLPAYQSKVIAARLTLATKLVQDLGTLLTSTTLTPAERTQAIRQSEEAVRELVRASQEVSYMTLHTLAYTPTSPAASNTGANGQ